MTTRIIKGGVRILFRGLRNTPMAEMARRFRRAYILVGPRGRRCFFIVQILTFISMLTATITYGIMATILLLLNDPTIADTNAYLSQVKTLLGIETAKGFLIAFCAFFIAYAVAERIIVVSAQWLIGYYRHILSRLVSSTIYGYYITWDYRYLATRDNNTMITEVQQAAQKIAVALFTPAKLVLMAFNIGLVLVALFYAHAVLTAILVAGMVTFYTVYYGVVQKRLYHYGQEKRRLNIGKLRLLRSGISPFIDLMFEGKDRELRGLFEDLAKRQAAVDLRLMLVNSIAQPVLRILTLIFIATTVIYLLLTDTPQGTLATIAIFTAGGLRLMPLSGQVQSAFMELKAQQFAFYKVIGKLETAFRQKGRLKELDEIKPLGLRESVVLDNVSYAYLKKDPPVLTNINLKFSVGQQIALCGFSGSGKTTLARMVCGLLEPDVGSLLVDGRNVWSDLKLRRAWHLSIAMMQQQPFFLPDTIAANVAFSMHPENIDRERVREMLEVAQLGEFVESLPKGINIMIGEYGLTLSGGQGQRLSIARAMYARTPLLILDETTSALDAVTEERILSGPVFAKQRHTTLIIAHRLEIMKNADLVCVMDEGRIVASGSYDELMESCNLFRQLARKQIKADEPEAEEKAAAQPAGAHQAPA